MRGPIGWLRARMGVRVVTALSAAAVVALALLAAGAALALLLEKSLHDSVQTGAEQRAKLIVDRVHGNFERVASENARNALEILARDDDLVQVLVGYGEVGDDDFNLVVEAGTEAVGRRGPMADLWPDQGDTVVVPHTTVRKADGSTVEVVLVAAGTDSASEDVVVLLAEPLTTVEKTTDSLLGYLAWGIPLLIVVAGVTTYLFAGRALRPVEAIRAQVAEMSEKDLARRVPVPPTRDEVGRLAETMNAMIARLQDAQGVQRRFVADASHELRSPLATIATGLELMQNGGLDASTVTALRGETSRLGNLVEALILLARADERGLQPRREEVDLDEVAELERGRPADGTVVAEVRALPVRVIGDRGQLARVVRNLVDNARRHARSRVLVAVRREDHDAVIEVSDDGPGVPPADRARVFERFVRLDDARSRADGGSGLGLAIVAEVVAAHGGTVEVTDAPGGGALFRVRLPAAEAPVADAEPEVDVPAARGDVPGGAAAAAGAVAAGAVVPGGGAGAGATVDEGRPRGARADGAARPTPTSRGRRPQSEGAQPDASRRSGSRRSGVQPSAEPGPDGQVSSRPAAGRRTAAQPARAVAGPDQQPTAAPGSRAATTPGSEAGAARPQRGAAAPGRGSGTPSGSPAAGALPQRRSSATPPEPRPPATAPPQPATAARPQPAEPPPRRRAPERQAPVRDDDARRDPATAPYGIPAQAPPPKPVRRPVPRPQSGPVIR